MYIWQTCVYIRYINKGAKRPPGGCEANFRKSISDGLARFNISRSEWLTVCREDERGWRKRVEEGGVFCLGEWLSKRAASKAKRDSGVDLVAQMVHRQSLREVCERGGRQRVRAPQPAHRQSSGEVSERGRGQGVRAPLPAHRQLLKVASDSVAGRAWGECTTEMFLDSCFITHPVLVPPADQ